MSFFDQVLDPVCKHCVRTTGIITMSFVHQAAKEFEAANEKYAASFNKGDLPLPPGRYVISSSLENYAPLSDR